ncbi:MAG TPA: aminopeptidase P family N-terminal domain-containing protein [Xanthobacteraceae bacterium]|nr:aminopeptidase P family N-terminal domain-containing protein [Xanthobacteraceae bacterium]
MRRGLIARSPDELPDGVLDARLERVHAAMNAASLDALILYTNNTRPAGVSWLTAFVPYWSEALLLVPRQGAPVLVVALTYRVKTWIERTSRVADVIHTPRIGLEAGRRVAAVKADAAVGVVELDMLSAGIAGDLAEGGPRLAITDASDVFAQVRAQPDAAEIALAKKAASIAHLALSRICRDGDDLGSMLGAAEAAARRQGAEEIYLAAAPDLDHDLRLRRIEGAVARGPSFAVRASVAYKGSWVRLTRTLHPDDAAARRAIDAFAGAVAQLPDARALAAFPSWLIEGCRLTQPLDAVMGSRATPPAAPLPRLVSVQARIDIDGTPVLIGAPVLLGVLGQPARLLAPPVFD